MRVAKTKKSMENDVKRQMKNLGVYKPDYDKIIKIFSGMLYQYQEFESQFEGSGYQITEEYTNKVGAVNERKVPLYTAMESLRKDIIAYSDRLCLNPKAIETVTTDKATKSKLAQVLSGLK